MRSRSFATLALLAALPLTGCGADPVDVVGPPSTVATADRATLVQYREDDIRGVFQVKFFNGGSSNVRVQTLRVVWAGLQPAEPDQWNYLVGAGQHVDLAVHYGTAICPDPPSLDDTPPVAPMAAEVTTDHGVESVPIDDVEGVLARIFKASCRRQAIDRAVTVSYGDTWTLVHVGGRPALRGTLRVGRGAFTGPIQVTAVDGSVLLTVEPTTVTDPVVDLPPGTDHAEVPIDIGREGRCDAHALSESKKTYVFQIGLTLGEDRVGIELVPNDDVKAQLFDVIKERCVNPTSSP